MRILAWLMIVEVNVELSMCVCVSVCTRDIYTLNNLIQCR